MIEMTTVDKEGRAKIEPVILVPKDYVQIVRCKDCKHRDPEDKKCDCGMWHLPYVTRDDDYCSYGERREERNK